VRSSLSKSGRFNITTTQISKNLVRSYLPSDETRGPSCVITPKPRPKTWALGGDAPFPAVGGARPEKKLPVAPPLLTPGTPPSSAANLRQHAADQHVEAHAAASFVLSVMEL
jgi:hypothetical protein